jgi:hypothetical protein
LDSPAGNAFSHFLHLPLLILGKDLETAASPIAVSAELYRANEIESFDTCSLRLSLSDGVPLHIVCTHACASALEPIITIEFEGATIRYVITKCVEIHGANGMQESMALSPRPHQHMLNALQRWIRVGVGNSSLGATLESARGQVLAVNAAAEATPVHDIAQEFVETAPSRDRAVIRTIREIVPALQACVAQRRMLHDAACVPWSRPGGSKETREYYHFGGPIRSASSDTPARRNVEVSVLAQSDDASSDIALAG